MSEPISPTPEERLLANLNSKQLELVSFYLATKAEQGLTVEQLAVEFDEKRSRAEYYPSGFHLVNQLNELAKCVEKHGGAELSGKLHNLIREMPRLLP
ncbi:MAG: hypothetical protein AAGM45_17805 [Cyanobacteria bacterium J06588_5]